MSNDNFFSTNLRNQQWKQKSQLNIFLGYPSDCEKICKIIWDYLNGEINEALKDSPIIFRPRMFKNKAPTSRSGGAVEVSLEDVKNADLFFAFFYREYGDGITVKETEKALSLRSSKHSIYDVCIFFKKLTFCDKLKGKFSKNQKKVNDFKEILKQKKGEKGLTYEEYSDEIKVIKKVSATIIQSICKIKMEEKSSEVLISGNGVGE